MRITNKVALWIVIIYTLIVMAVFLLPLTVNAAEFSDLTDKAKENYITSITEQISKDLGVQTTPKLFFYNSPEWHVIASYYDGIDYIYVNIGVLNSYEEAVRAMAHEVRHDYQYEHMNDDSEYGRAVKANKQNYISYYTNINGYYNQFIEKDAEEYATDYVNRN